MKAIVGAALEGASSISNKVSGAFDVNTSTLSGAIDIIVVRQPDGTLRSTPFHVRFGKLQLLKPREKVVGLTVNGTKVEPWMKLGYSGEAFFIEEGTVDPLTLSELKSPSSESAKGVADAAKAASPATPDGGGPQHAHQPSPIQPPFALATPPSAPATSSPTRPAAAVAAHAPSPSSSASAIAPSDTQAASSTAAAAAAAPTAAVGAAAAGVAPPPPSLTHRRTPSYNWQWGHLPDVGRGSGGRRSSSLDQDALALRMSDASPEPMASPEDVATRGSPPPPLVAAMPASLSDASAAVVASPVALVVGGGDGRRVAGDGAAGAAVDTLATWDEGAQLNRIQRDDFLAAASARSPTRQAGAPDSPLPPPPAPPARPRRLDGGGRAARTRKTCRERPPPSTRSRRRPSRWRSRRKLWAPCYMRAAAARGGTATTTPSANAPPTVESREPGGECRERAVAHWRGRCGHRLRCRRRRRRAARRRGSRGCRHGGRGGGDAAAAARARGAGWA